MPTPTPHRNQSPNIRKSIEWSRHKKNIDMKEVNSSEISKPACLYLSKSSQLMATVYKYSSNNNNNNK